MQVRIECQGAKNLALDTLYPTQDQLKELSQENYAKLKNEILSEGFCFPFFVWQHEGINKILDGHHRRLVLLKMQEEGYNVPDLPCAVVNAIDEKDAAKKLLAVTSQYAKITDQGLYEFMSKFEIDISELNDRFEFSDIKMDEFEANFFTEPETMPDGDEDSIPDVLHEPITKRGDVWILGDHRLMCGDSTMIDDVEKLMAGEKADMVFTSPPYNANAKTGDGDIFNGKKSKKMYEGAFIDNQDSESYIHFAKDVLEMCFSFTDGFIFWNVSYNAKSRFEYIKQLEERYSFLMEQICWKKSSTIPFKGSLMRDWEPIFLFSTDKKTLGLEKVVSNHWEVNNSNSQGENHKACFPVALPERAIDLLPKSKILLEPFCGSGSTLIACEKTNRKCYGMELDEHYCDVIIKRWQEYTGKKASLESGDLCNDLLDAQQDIR